MTLGTHLYLPKSYACAKFGCYSSINDVNMTPSFLFKSHIKSFAYVLTQVLFGLENVASVLI